MEIKRGDIYYADLRPVKGSEQSGIRPVLVIQNDVGNHYSPTVIVAAITGRKKKWLPTHVRLFQQDIFCHAGADTHHRPIPPTKIHRMSQREQHGSHRSGDRNQHWT